MRWLLRPFFDILSQSKVQVMDGKTILLLGLGVVALLVLGFFALPA